MTRLALLLRLLFMLGSAALGQLVGNVGKASAQPVGEPTAGGALARAATAAQLKRDPISQDFLEPVPERTPRRRLRSLDQGPAKSTTPTPAEMQLPLDAVPTGRPLTPKMIQAEPKPDEAYDHIVAIRFRKNGVSQICTGVAISADAVLTAGHCACGDTGTYDIVTGPRGNRNATNITGRFAIRSMIPFPGYRCELPPERQAGLDVALVLLAQRYDKLARLRRPISLLGPLIAQPPQALKVYGYGYTETGAIGERRGAPIAVATLTCTGREWSRIGCAGFREFVLSQRGVLGVMPSTALRDSCGGDSGGPVFWGDGSLAYLVGLVSRAVDLRTVVAGQPCGGGGIYSNVGRHSVINWLRHHGVDVCVKGAACGAYYVPP